MRRGISKTCGATEAGRMSDEVAHEIECNLAALELFPREWIREVGDRISLPKKTNKAVFAYLWSNCGFSKRAVRELVGVYCGSLSSYWRIDCLIAEGQKIVEFRTDTAR